MAVAYRSGTASAASTTTSRTGVTAPSGLADGDILIGFMYAERNLGLTGPVGISGGGWTAIHDTLNTGPSPDINAFSFWKLAASEGASYDFTWGGDSVWNQAAVIAISGADGTTPLDGTPTENTGSSAAPTGLSITTAAAGSLLVWMSFNFDGRSTSTYDSPLTEQFDSSGSTNLALATGNQAVAGASGNKAAVYSATTNWIIQMVAIQVPTGGGPPPGQPLSARLQGVPGSRRTPGGFTHRWSSKLNIWLPAMPSLSLARTLPSA